MIAMVCMLRRLAPVSRHPGDVSDQSPVNLVSEARCKVPPTFEVVSGTPRPRPARSMPAAADSRLRLNVPAAARYARTHERKQDSARRGARA